MENNYLKAEDAKKIASFYDERQRNDAFFSLMKMIKEEAGKGRYSCLVKYDQQINNYEEFVFTRLKKLGYEARIVTSDDKIMSFFEIKW